MNFELIFKEVLKQSFLLTGKIKNEEVINNLKEFIKKNKDKNLSHKTNVKGEMTKFETLAENFYFLKFMKLIHEYTKQINKFNYCVPEAWGTISKINDEVTEHNHAGIEGFCGVLYLTEGGPGTYFKELNLTINEEVGKFILFDPQLIHSVPKISNEIERITLAFNARIFKPWEDTSNIKWIKNDDI